METAPMIRWRDSITSRFFSYSLLCFAAIAFVFTGIYCFFIYSKEQDHLNDYLLDISNTRIPRLVEALWITDHAEVQKTVSAIAGHRYIAGVEVTDDSGMVFSSGTNARNATETSTRELFYAYKDASIRIGSITLYIDRRGMTLGVVRSALLVLGIQSLMALFLSGVMAWAFHMSFGRNIRRFGQFIKSDDPARFTLPLVIERSKPRKDELQMLVERFNGLRGKINDYMFELKAANDKLRESNDQLLESEERFRAAFQASANAACLSKASDGVIIEINEGYSNITGFSPQEVRGQSSLTHDIWVDPEDRRRLIAELGKTSQIKGFEYFFRRKDGAVRLASMNARLISIKNVPHIVSVTRDITDERKTQQALEESEKKYRLLVENAGQAIYVAQESMLRLVNRKTMEITGYSAEELTTREMTELIHPEDRRMVVDRHIRRQKGEDAPSSYSFRIVSRSGEIKWIDLNVVSIEWEGKPATLNLLTDITRRRHAEEELHRAHERLEFIIEGSGLGTWVWNVQTNETMFNEIWATMIGYTIEEIQPYNCETWERLVHPDDLIGAKKRLSDCIEGKANDYSSDFRMKHKNGHWVWIMDRGRIMTRDAEGRPLLMFGTHSDITEAKRAQEELAGKFNELRQALDEIKTLRGIVPICASCKKIRDDQGYWQQVEIYIARHSEAEFSHGICPDCMRKLYPDFCDQSDCKEG